MDIRVLRYFIEVVQLNGFSRAADALFITQPAISRSIKKLEDELGTVLLIREVDGVKLTDDGAILYEHAKQILAQFNSMNKALNDKDEPLTGALNVGLPPVIASTYFADIIMAFSSRHPNVELKIFELGTKQMEDAMLEGTVETAAVMLPFNDKDFELTIFSEDHLMLLVAQSHPLAKDKKVNFKQLITERFIFFSEDFRINDLVRSACGIYNTEPQIVGRSNHLDLIIAMVKAGVGITLLPNSMCNKYPIDNLVVIPIASPRLSYQLALATNQNSYQSRSCQAWNKLAIEKLMKENI
ncbi:LysR family transcriptional regulator [Proteus mirabilis]|uniref:LysR family transcriptional regulator n=1 Tax=Proteus mirabilis TaxID=584 RepID=UPI0018C7AE2C|nr:LysR family transcriptional regulator [Proteus mirabilis]MBG6040536.1 LysR family transcriptional regulator [Proteus mirabilis]MCY9777818.1 LysR family transcriptional regulator [Proteus mirabilis]MCY9779876.1 LysR family transcriptional regulator [Proteus mirabilis]MCY9788645.1 LysR family transcriptional regulator [Proteus mirabilis]